MQKRRRKPVLQFDLNRIFIKRWDSPICVQNELGWSKSSISEVCKGVHKQAYGYIWEYEKK